MRVIPKTPAKQISFFQSHIAKWAENAAQIGLDAADVADIEAKLDAAKAAFLEQRAALSKARTATAKFHSLTDELTRAGAVAILKVRGKAASGGNIVYRKASLPAPKKGSPIGVPGEPFRFETKLLPMGELRLTWKCKHPRNADGTMYKIRRQLWRAGENRYGESVFLAVTGKKQFVDWTIPAGTAMALYQVQAVRSTRHGVTAEHMVTFGGSGKVPAFVKAQQKMAA